MFDSYPSNLLLFFLPHVPSCRKHLRSGPIRMGEAIQDPCGGPMDATVKKPHTSALGLGGPP